MEISTGGPFLSDAEYTAANTENLTTHANYIVDTYNRKCR
jgi:hypothetical protein